MSRMAPAPYHFELAEAEAFAHWRMTIGPAFDIGAEPEEIGLFVGEVASWSTNRFVLSRTKCSTIRLVRSAETIQRDGLDHFAISLVACGRIAGIAGTTDLDAGAGDVYFTDLLQTRLLRMSVRGGLTEEITLWVPRTRLFSSVSNDNSLHGVVIKGASPAGAVVGAALRAMSTHAKDMTTEEMDGLADGLVECSARAVAPLLKASATPSAAVSLASFVTIRRFIDRNLGSFKLDAASIAKNFGLSRASLYRLFEPAGGVASYIREQRLKKAYQEITAPELSNRRIALIAHQSGFENISSFSRAFKAAYGMSPGEARATSLRGLSGTLLKPPQNSEISLSGLLAKLKKATEIKNKIAN